MSSRLYWTDWLERLIVWKDRLERLIGKIDGKDWLDRFIGNYDGKDWLGRQGMDDGIAQFGYVAGGDAAAVHPACANHGLLLHHDGGHHLEEEGDWRGKSS